LPTSEISDISEELPHELQYLRTVLSGYLITWSKWQKLWAADFRWKHTARSWWRRNRLSLRDPWPKKAVFWRVLSQCILRFWCSHPAWL